MKTIKAIILTALILTIGNAVGFAFSEKDDSSKALQVLQMKPKLEVKIYQPNTYINGSMDIHVYVTNLTDMDIVLNDIEVIMPGDYIDARRGDNLNLVKDMNEDKLQPGNDRAISFAIRPSTSSIFIDLFNIPLMTFVPNDYEATIIVKYQVPPEGEKTVQENVKIHFEPPMLSVMAGGIFGSLLLSIFIGLYSYKNRKAGEPKRWFDFLGEYLLLFGSGAICAIIVILLLFRFKEVALPINLEISDFYGGIVLGLFTYKLGKWLYDKLTGTNDGKNGKPEHPQQ